MYTHGVVCKIAGLENVDFVSRERLLLLLSEVFAKKLVLYLENCDDQNLTFTFRNERN